MKIEKILQYESQNNDAIILFKEGIFFRAYERSAMRFTEYVAPFKVFKRYYVMKLDLSGFFMSINRRKLFKMV